MGDRMTGTPQRDTGRTVRWWRAAAAATGSGPLRPRRPGPGVAAGSHARGRPGCLGPARDPAPRARRPGPAAGRRAVFPEGYARPGPRAGRLAGCEGGRPVPDRDRLPEFPRTCSRDAPPGRALRPGGGGVLRSPPRPRGPGRRRGSVRARARPGVPDPARPGAGAGSRPGGPCHSRGGAARRPGASPLFRADRRPVCFRR